MNRLAAPETTTINRIETDTRMKAIVRAKYGSPDVLHLEEVERPAPGDDEVLVKIHAASVNAADWHILRAKPFLVRLMGYGLLEPSYKILGGDVAGQVEAVGGNVRKFQPGDEVFGNIRGGFAEYASARESELTLKPTNISFEQAAAVPLAAATALQGLRKGRIQPGQKALDQWRVRRSWYVRGADSQVVRNRSDRGLQHKESGDGALNRGRSHHRLQQGELHPE